MKAKRKQHPLIAGRFVYSINCYILGSIMAGVMIPAMHFTWRAHKVLPSTFQDKFCTEKLYSFGTNFQGKRIIEMPKKRPAWFAENLLEPTTQPTADSSDVKPQGLA